jgi:hypothetical protein
MLTGPEALRPHLARGFTLSQREDAHACERIPNACYETQHHAIPFGERASGAVL